MGTGVVLPQEIGVGALDGVEVFGHGGPVLGEYGGVAGLYPGGPGDDDTGVAPACSGIGTGGRYAGGEDAEEIAGNIGACAAAKLSAAYVAGVFAGECGEVHVVGGGAPKDLGIGGPAQAFIALRAVGGDADEVGALAPEDVAPKLVDQGAAGFELGGEGCCGVEDDALDRIECGLVGKAGEFEIAVAVEGELRFELFDSLPGEGEVVGGFCCTEIIGIEGAVGVEDFAGSDLDGCACRALQAEFFYA